ncbi:MAG: hypothetical protein HY260_02465 [Chloroflexi bacterium]|nr:hypothetical protein [Chloroflexota bacterium]
MRQTTAFRSREEVFDFLDDYAFERKEEIDRRQLGKETGLIKTYVFETSPENPASSGPVTLLRGTDWQVEPIGHDGLYTARDSEGELGFIELVSPRHLMLHSIRKKEKADGAVIRAVRNTAQLDSLWLAGEYFLNLWKTVILPQSPDRFITLKFEHLTQFEDAAAGFDETDDDREEERSEENIAERRASISTITERAERVGKFLPQLQSFHPPFKAVKMLRIPASERGGYEFWSWGKITYRAPSFREGREQALSVTRLYEQTTRAIERTLWLRTEPVAMKGGEGLTLRGAPLVLQFSQPLSLSTFHNLVAVTFERGQGPLRLWGNPIWLNERKVHVYGIDLHLWQRLYLELTPYRMVVVMPHGTCGNTAHRLMTNIQRYVDPAVTMYIGETTYSDIIREALLGKTVD